MSPKQPVTARLRRLVRVWVDAVTYAVALAAVSAVVALTLGITTGGGIVRGKHLLFIFGWGMMAYATAKLWVKSGKQLRSARMSSQQGGKVDEEKPGSEEPPDSMATASELRSRVSDSSRHTYGESLPEKQDTTRFQLLVQSLPPNRWVTPPRPERRMGLAGKLLLASVFVLGVSFVMETVFGVV